MARIDNDALISDQGCHISNSPETHGLNGCALCWVCLAYTERVNNAFELRVAFNKININLGV